MDKNNKNFRTLISHEPQMDFISKVKYVDIGYNGDDFENLTGIFKEGNKDFFLIAIDDMGGKSDYTLLQTLENNSENIKYFGDVQCVLFYKIKSKEFPKLIIEKFNEYKSQFLNEYDSFVEYLEYECGVMFDHGFGPTLMDCLELSLDDYEELFELDLEIDDIRNLSENTFVVDECYESGDCTISTFIGYMNS